MSKVNGYDSLGYGTHLILDGFRADAACLADEEAFVAALRAIFASMGGSRGEPVVVHPEGDRGMSGAIVGAEAYLCLHTFPALDKLSLEAFSGRALPSQPITEAVVERFGVGRVECRIHGRGRLLPRGREALVQGLLGDRSYARLRLRDLLRA